MNRSFMVGALYGVGFFLICFALSLVYSLLTQKIEGFTDGDCATIPLSAYVNETVMNHVTPSVQYAISMYSTGDLNFHKEVRDAFVTGTPDVQMAISALLARYLALNGGSAAIPGPGYLFTSSPGNYTTQLQGAVELLSPAKVDTNSSVYPSFLAATSVARCPRLNAGWVSTADFPKTLPPLSNLYQYATPMTGIGPGPRVDHDAVN